LRQRSVNGAALRAMARLAPFAGMEIVFGTGPGDLPHYNHDLDGDPCPDKVMQFRREVELSDGLLLAMPEYAHGMAGAFKNALDWLVSSLAFPEKPVALINTAPRASHAQAQLREVLTTMSARIIEPAAVTLPMQGRDLDDAAIAADPDLSTLLRSSLAAFSTAITEISQR
jgi:chromate reductase